MKKKRQSYENYNHRVIWSSAKRCLKQAEADQRSAKQFSLCAMTMMYFAFEGYMNWLGDRLLPEVWKSERQFFKRDPYFGTLGKFQLITRVLHISDWDDNSAPLSTVIGLQALRDKVAHPKTERGEREIDYEFPATPPQYIGSLAELSSLELAKQAEKDLVEIADRLHEACHKQFPGNFPKAKPFCGLLGYSTTEI